MLRGLFVILVTLYPDQIFFAGISITDCFLAQPGSPSFLGFLSFVLSFLSTSTGWVEGDRSIRLVH